MKYYIDRNVLCRMWVNETYSVEADNYDEAVNKLIAATEENNVDIIPDSDTIKLVGTEEYVDDIEPLEPKDNNGEYTLEIPDNKGKLVYTNA